MSDQRIDDGSSITKYATVIPNMADDDLDPYQYRLYAHYKRVCGANGGTCWESANTTAAVTQMSRPMVIKVRGQLEASGWIACTEQGPKRPILVNIVDRWPENTDRYSGKSSQPRDINMSHGLHASQPRDKTCKPSDINMSHGLLKEKPMKKNQEEDPPPAAVGTRKPTYRQQIAAEHTKAAAAYGLVASDFTALVDAYLTACGTAATANADTEMGERELRKAKDAAVTGLASGILEPADVVKRLAAFQASWGQDKTPYYSQIVNQQMNGKAASAPVEVVAADEMDGVF